MPHFLSTRPSVQVISTPFRTSTRLTRVPDTNAPTLFLPGSRRWLLRDTPPAKCVNFSNCSFSLNYATSLCFQYSLGSHVLQTAWVKLSTGDRALPPPQHFCFRWTVLCSPLTPMAILPSTGKARKVQIINTGDGFTQVRRRNEMLVDDTRMDHTEIPNYAQVKFVKTGAIETLTDNHSDMWSGPSDDPKKAPVPGQSRTLGANPGPALAAESRMKWTVRTPLRFLDWYRRESTRKNVAPSSHAPTAHPLVYTDVESAYPLRLRPGRLSGSAPEVIERAE